MARRLLVGAAYMAFSAARFPHLGSGADTLWTWECCSGDVQECCAQSPKPRRADEGHGAQRGDGPCPGAHSRCHHASLPLGHQRREGGRGWAGREPRDSLQARSGVRVARTLHREVWPGPCSHRLCSGRVGLWMTGLRRPGSKETPASVLFTSPRGRCRLVCLWHLPPPGCNTPGGRAGFVWCETAASVPAVRSGF